MISPSSLRRVLAPAPPPSSTKTNLSELASSSGSCLGLIPHQIRGHLSSFANSVITGSAYDRCTACSSLVVEAYQQQGWDMLKMALGQEGYLEKLTGLDKLYEETERLLEEGGGVDEWSEGEEED